MLKSNEELLQENAKIKRENKELKQRIKKYIYENQELSFLVKAKLDKIRRINDNLGNVETINRRIS